MKLSAKFFAIALGVDILFCGLMLVSFAGHAPFLQEFISVQGSWWLWRSEALWRARPVIAGATLLLAGGTWLLGRRVLCVQPYAGLTILAPLALTILLMLVFLYRDCLPHTLVANLIFYLPLCLLALFLARGSFCRAPGNLPQEALCKRRPFAFLLRWWPELRLHPAWAILVVTSIIFFMTGIYYTRYCGPHSGDEGHYLIQAASVYEDHDIDIKNNIIDALGAENVQRIGPYYLHISPFSRPPHWFSYHAPGLSFLLAPVIPGGDAARHGVLGIIAGLACTAMWLLCRRSGASSLACGVVLVSFWCSIYWTVYASRALPEVLGAGLVTWLCWSALAQKDYPWRTALLTGFCCAYLPWAHIRFYPLALAGLALYSVSALRSDEPCPRRWLRIGVFLLIGIGGLALYRHFQNQMFTGGFAHEVGELLFAYPPGLWRAWTIPQGLLNTFPLALWLVAASLVWIAVALRHRWMAVALLGMFALSWLSTCAVPNYGGGSTLGGRFMLVVMPLLMPGAAALWGRVMPAARWWLIFLAVISVALCGLELLKLPELGRAFDCPFSDLPAVIPVLQGLQYPFCGPVHALVLLLLTVILLSLRRARPAALLASIMLLGSVAWHAAGVPGAMTSDPLREPTDPAQVSSRLAHVDLEQIRVSPLLMGQGMTMFDVSDHLHALGQSNVAPSLTTRDLGLRMQGNLVSQPRLEVNDWQGRPYRWTTLAAPFDPGRGQRAFFLEGQIEGRATPVLAIREGSNTITEQSLKAAALGEVRFKVAVFTEGRCGHLYLLLRLEGDGVFHTRRLHWSPVSQRLLDQLGLAW